MYLRRVKWHTPPLESQGVVYTQVATPIVMEDRIRILYAGRINNITHIYSLELSPPPSFDIISFDTKPIFYPNRAMGAFDDEGVMPSCVVKEAEEYYLFYSGWNSRNTIPYHNATGIAKYDIEKNIVIRMSDGPVMDRNYEHPYLAVTPCIWKDKNRYNALYISGLSWKKHNEKYEPLYVIKFATSENLIDWQRPVEQFIESRYELECFSNPTIKKGIDESFDILFCSRHCFDYRDSAERGYKIGYAKLQNNQVTRRDVKWVGNMFKGKDDIMQCYPSFFQWDEKDYVVYNGNGFGATGFGIAEVMKRGCDE